MSKLYRGLMSGLKQLKATEYSKRTGKRDWTYFWFNLKVNILETLVYSWLDPIRRFWESIVRTAKWFPIIWKDRHWDHWFILEILRHKIRFQRECIGKYNRHTTAMEDCKNMRIAEFLIKRIQDDNYYEIPMKEHEAKWGELDWSFKNRNKDDDILLDNKFSNSGLTRPNIKSQKDWEQERKEAGKIYDHAKYMKSQDYDYLFKHLKKHLERWWD